MTSQLTKKTNIKILKSSQCDFFYDSPLSQKCMDWIFEHPRASPKLVLNNERIVAWAPQIQSDSNISCMASWDSKHPVAHAFHIGNALGSLTPQHRWDHVLWLLDLQKTNYSCGYCKTPCDGGNGQVPTCGEVDCHRIMQGSNDSTMASTNVPLYIRGWIYTILIYIHVYIHCIFV